MKTLQAIKDEVANTQGHRNWDTFMEYKTYSIKDKFLNEVAKRYASEAIKQAAERVTMTVERNGNIISEKQRGWIAEDHDHLEPNKKSILSLINELK